MIPIIGVTIPVVAIWTNHLQKMAQIKAQSGSATSLSVQAELDRLREELASLRETTTRFDMSFDAALTRLEDRMDGAESTTTAFGDTPASASTNPNVVPETLFAGRRR